MEPGVFGLEALQFEGNVLGGSIRRDVDYPLFVADVARRGDKSDRPLEGPCRTPQEVHHFVHHLAVFVFERDGDGVVCPRPELKDVSEVGETADKAVHGPGQTSSAIPP